MKLLTLTIKKIFFDQIHEGQKRIEYRVIKPYWEKRIENREYDQICFRNGYSQHSPRLIIEYKGYFKKNGFYCIHLGKILSTHNLQSS